MATKPNPTAAENEAGQAEFESRARAQAARDAKLATAPPPAAPPPALSGTPDAVPASLDSAPDTPATAPDEPKQAPRRVTKDASTGEFVSQEHAERHPSTTVTITVDAHKPAVLSAKANIEKVRSQLAVGRDWDGQRDTLVAMLDAATADLDSVS